jgi:uncharacterized protein (DUF1501 family)
LPPASEDTVMPLLDLYQHSDPALARGLEKRLEVAAIARSGALQRADKAPAARPPSAQAHAYFAESAGAAAKFLARPDGPRIGALAYDGWDTHADQGAVGGRLSKLLGALDAALGTIEAGLGPAWNETVVTVMTEFGRTARINGTAGTDHGTATVMLLAGGALRGGRVVTDWPGLKDAQLYEGRDLRPTIDVRAVLKGVLSEHLRLDEAVLAAKVFLGSRIAKPVAGLVRTA